MTRPPRPAALAALAVIAVVVGTTAACAPLGGAGGGAATASASLSTPTTAVSTSAVLGNGVATPAPTSPLPAAVATTTAVQFVTVTAAPAPTTPTPTATPASTCSDLTSRRVVSVAAQVAVSKGAATVTWPSHAGTSLKGWRVQAVRQDLRYGAQPPGVWQQVAAPPGCQNATTTFTGLVSGARYTFLLHAMLSTTDDPGPTAELVGRSPTVTIS